MKKFFILALLALTSLAHAQFTSVTATVQYPDTQVLANGNVTANFVPLVGQIDPTKSLLNGSPFPYVVTANIDGSGTFNMSLADQTKVGPISGSWLFTICPAANLPCIKSLQNVFGSSINLSSNLNAAITAAQGNSTNLPKFYNDTEASLNLGEGVMYYNLVSKKGRFYNGTIWQDMIGSATGTVTSVGMTVPTGFQLTGSPITSTGTLAISMPSGWNVGSLLVGTGANSVAAQSKAIYDCRDSNCVGDGQIATDCWMTSGSPTLTCATSHFTANDVGKVIAVYEAGVTSGGFDKPLSSTIQAFVSGTQVTLNDNASSTTTNTVSTLTACSRDLSTITGFTVTCTTSGNHNLVPLQMVSINTTGGTDLSLIGTFVVQSTPAANQFVFYQWQQPYNLTLTVGTNTVTGYSSRVVWGTNNDTALANARDAAATAGKVLYIPKGIYLTHGLNIPCSKVGNWTSAGLGICTLAYNNFTVEGDGIETTLLENWDIATSGSTNQAVIYAGGQSDLYPYIYNSNGPRQSIANLYLHDFAVRQIKFASGGIKGVRVDNTNGYRIDHVKVSSWSYEGFYLAGINYEISNSISYQSGFGGPSVSTTTAGFNLISPWGYAHDNWAYDSGQCFEAGAPWQRIQNNVCDGHGDDITSFISPHQCLNVTSNTSGTWKLNFDNNTCDSWTGAGMGNILGKFKDVSISNNLFIDDSTGIQLGSGKETNNVNRWPEPSPYAHGSSTCNHNRFLSTGGARPVTYYLTFGSGSGGPLLENWTCDDNVIVYSTAYCDQNPTITQIAPSCPHGNPTVPAGNIAFLTPWVNLWASTTAYTANTSFMQATNQTNRYIYIATVSGTSGGSEPVECQTLGCTFTDGSVTWQLYGLKPQIHVSHTRVSTPQNEIRYGNPDVIINSGITGYSSMITIDDYQNTNAWSFQVGGVTTVEPAMKPFNFMNGVASFTLNSTDWLTPGAIGSTTPNTGAFTTLSATGQFTSTVSTGTAPFSVASTTNVPNLNASSLNGATFASPGAIGGTTPGSGAFTTLSSSGQYTNTVSTGTAPLVISSTTPVSNLTVARHPLVQFCGTTATCSATIETNGQVVHGSAALVSGSPSTVTITGISPAFTSTATYDCTVTNVTAANTLFVTKASASSITITGPNTVTDTVSFVCVGH